MWMIDAAGLDFWIVGSAKIPVDDNAVYQDLDAPVSLGTLCKWLKSVNCSGLPKLPE
jgi:hypothetical protein